MEAARHHHQRAGQKAQCKTEQAQERGQALNYPDSVRGGAIKSEGRPHAKQIGHESEPPMPSPDAAAVVLVLRDRSARSHVARILFTEFLVTPDAAAQLLTVDASMRQPKVERTIPTVAQQ